MQVRLRPGGDAAARTVQVLASLVVEVAYAALFFHAVEGRTKGEEQARFRRINRLT